MNDVKLTYFKKGGKYYDEGKYKTCCEFGFEVYDEVKHLKAIGYLPGLLPGCGREFTILVEPLFNDNPPAIV